MESVDGEVCEVRIEFTPTVPHCTLATTIGLCLREKLRRELGVPAKVRMLTVFGAKKWLSRYGEPEIDDALPRSKFQSSNECTKFSVVFMNVFSLVPTSDLGCKSARIR